MEKETQNSTVYGSAYTSPEMRTVEIRPRRYVCEGSGDIYFPSEDDAQ